MIDPPLMGFLMEESSCILLTHVLYKAALVFALLRWAFSWAVKLRQSLSSSSSSTTRVSAQMIRDNLGLTTYSQMVCQHRKCDTCAVCLCPIGEDELVRELRNCSHVFHRECIDTWVDHDDQSDDIYSDQDLDNHRSCPLCRAPLLTSTQSQSPDTWPRSEPSWAVDEILYLFADDLLY